MNWRPKVGWENPYKRGRYIAVQHPDKHIGETFENEEKEFQIYEAGADAMLEALRAEGYPYKYRFAKGEKRPWLPERLVGGQDTGGVLVFIPDDDTD